MGKIIYITGAPATGKSTLCLSLAQPGSGIATFRYSERLRDHVNRSVGTDLDETDIRRESSRVVTAKHVSEVDELLRQEVKEAKNSGTHLLVDSHPVTKEQYGFRITPFSSKALSILGFDVFISLFAAPRVLAKRIQADPQGRPLPTHFELALHVQLQASVVAQYAVLVGATCHLVDSSCSKAALATKVRALAGI